MKVALALLAYAALVGAAAVPLLRRARWVDRAPRLAVLTWLAAVTAMLISVVVGGFGLAVPIDRLSGSLAELLRGCVTALHLQFATPGGVVVGVAGLVVSVAVVVRLLSCGVAGAVQGGLRRRDHRRMLAMVGRREARSGVFVVEHEVPAAYCLPGRRGGVVITSAALSSLAEDEIEAVLAHERAHLRGRHHMLTRAVAILDHAFGFVPAFRTARREVDRLVELLADDSASRSCSRLAVADALLAVATSPAPAGALAAGGSTTAHRVRRLIRSEAPLTRLQRVGHLLAAAALVAVPVLVSAAPAVAATLSDHCAVTVEPHHH